MNKLILHSKPWIEESDIAAIKEVLYSMMLAQGEKAQVFEQTMSRWVGAEDGGVAVGRGAAAILLSLLALEVQPYDEVILPTYVCHTVLEAVLTSGAIPILCDTGPSWVMITENISPHISSRTKAIIVPHIYGIFADVSGFRKFGIPIIEDCAQAIDKCGKRKIEGDIAIFSFHPTKCLTTGEGGMAISADQNIVAKMRKLRDGDNSAPSKRLFSPLSDIASSLGISQLSRYDKAIERRRQLANRYIERLLPIIPDLITNIPIENTMWFRFPIQIPGGLDAFQELFAKRGINIRRGVDPLLHRLVNLDDAKYPVAVKHFNETISLPIYPAMTDEEHEHAVNASVNILKILSIEQD